MRAFRYEHVVTFDETNLVGNVYFAHYLHWQGRCRELFLAEHAPGVVKLLTAGELALVTVACSMDFFAECFALDRVEVLMTLRERAWSHGIRLASDMVPNHMGIDSRWVIEHPDWFLALPYSPYPAYTFNGPDLSSDGRVAIVLEDHYWDGTDAAGRGKRRT